MNTYTQMVRSFLEKHISDNTFENGDDLFACGLVNSLFAMELVLFVEGELSINIENEDLNPDNFKSVNAISGFMQGKMSEKT